MAALLPGCMEPDGADPCLAFTILQEKVESQKTEIDRLRWALHRAHQWLSTSSMDATPGQIEAECAEALGINTDQN